MGETKMTQSPSVESEGDYLIVNGTVLRDTKDNRRMAREIILDNQ